MNNKEKLYWDKFYKSQPNITQPSDFAKYVNKKYIEDLNKKRVFMKIGDLGCGNCRDSLLFSSLGNYVYAIDKSGLPYKKHPNLNLILNDVENALTNNKLQTLLDMIYMRWFLHAVPYDKGKTIFCKSVKNLKPNGLICIEVRSLNDTELIKNSKYNNLDKSYSTTHKRWLYTTDMIKQLAEKNNLEILELSENYNFSKTDNKEAYISNPLLIRFIARKKLIPHYEKSTNYNIYKNIITQTKDRTLRSYTHLEKFNTIVAKHNIKYVGVAGSVLGLNRHGGIIPWDNDIDVGFIQSEWTKLLKIIPIFEKNGLKYYPNNSKTGLGSSHFHLGAIDCFLLKDKGEYYCGDAKTFCHKEEYNRSYKQIFGYTYLKAPFCSKKSLSHRYGKTYFFEGDVNDNFHYKNNAVKRFKLNFNDYSFQPKE
jgi:phosphorylcholine metabolism protein LicD